MGNLNRSPSHFLAELFEFEYCEECGGDVQHHTCIPVMGNWFARCDYPPNEQTGETHPVIKQFREPKENRRA